jgi:iron complex outermembrane receptor protein
LLNAFHIDGIYPIERSTDEARRMHRDGLYTSPSVLLGALLVSMSCCASSATLTSNHLADMSFEELGNIEVTSVSKKTERLADAAASVFVITGEEIRRSGATSIPEALRLAPNLQVAQIDAQRYAISARGFNNSVGNKLLVLLDGRIAYTPLFSGVFWDTQDVLIEDIDRIEVISGPGGTLWGTNAVNGVINVITRSAADTQGGLYTVGAGKYHEGVASRYGGKLGNGGHYRVYGKHSDRDNTTRENGSVVRDGWNRTQAGFRSDWGSEKDRFTLQGDAYTGKLDQPASQADISGLNLMTRWQRKSGDGSATSVHAYYDHTVRNFPGSYREALDIVNGEFQHSFQPVGRHSVVVGASYRHAWDRVANSTTQAFLPANVQQKWISLFTQDEIALDTDLRLILGARLERNDYTGLEFLPSGRLAWKLSDRQLLWTAASRTVRAPSRLDRDLYAPAQAPFVLRGNTSFRSEVANVIELGYRSTPMPAFSYSVTAFHTKYDHLRSIETHPSGGYVIGNQMEGTTTGIETWATYQATDTWRLSAGYTAFKDRLRLKAGSTDPIGTSAAGNNPAHTWQLRSTLNVAPRAELDVTLRHVAALPLPAIPAYTTLDARFGWKLRQDLELSLTGQNLLDQNHAEFGTSPNRSRISPGIFVKLVWQN